MPTDYLLSEKVLLPKALLQEKRNKKPIVNTVSTTRRTTFCYMGDGGGGGEIKDLLLIKGIMYLPLVSFRKKSQKSKI